MPRAATLTHPVQVRFTPDAVKRITAVAAAEGWTWRPATAMPPIPSVSDAVRRLVTEALDTRDAPTSGKQGHPVAIPPTVLAWIDGEADRTATTRDALVVDLLREAATARRGNRP